MAIDLQQEIKIIQFLGFGIVKKLMVDNMVAYLHRTYSSYVVAIPYDYNQEINEEFVGIKLLTNVLTYDDDQIKILYLESSDGIDIEKFSYIGAHFINPNNRDAILTNPYKWVDEWKKIFGDSITKKMVYDVIGELYTLKYIYENDKSASWEGPSGGSHDIVTSKILYEVKSTILKNNNEVSINSVYQLDKIKKEKLIFCRLELKPYSYCINNLVDQLVALGYSREVLEEKLMKIGYAKGSRVRNISYEVINMLSYDVNEYNFPIISLDKINEFAPRKNITNYSLKLNLTSLNHDIII